MFVHFLHSVRCFKAQKSDTGFQYFFCQDKHLYPGSFLVFVLLAEDLCFVVETVKSICQFINIRTDLVRRFLLECRLDHTVQLCQGHHQGFFAVICRSQDLTGLEIAPFFFISVQNRFDPDNGIQDIRACISFKRSKSVHIKNIIFGRLVERSPYLIAESPTISAVL